MLLEGKRKIKQELQNENFIQIAEHIEISYSSYQLIFLKIIHTKLLEEF